MTGRSKSRSRLRWGLCRTAFVLASSVLRRNQAFHLARCALVIILITLDGPAIAQGSGNPDVSWPKAANVILFVVAFLVLAMLSKFDDAYFDWVKRRVPRCLFLTIALGGLGLALLIAGIGAGSVILK